MPVTKAEIRNILTAEEPDYEKAAKLGSEALPHLKKIISEDDEATASKATYLAGLIKDAKRVNILIIAASSQSDLVRIAAAASAKNLKSEEANKVLEMLAEDVRYGVRKMVLKSTPKKPSAELVKKIELIAASDHMRQLRNKASSILKNIDASP